MTVEESWQRIVSNIGVWVLRGFGAWAVEEKETGAFIGEFGFTDARRDGLSSMHGSPEAGWFLSAGRHHQGYGTEAVQAIHEWADAHFADGRTVCGVRPENSASMRLAEKVGPKGRVP